MAKLLTGRPQKIDIKKIDPPEGQVRMKIDQAGIRELADSIGAVGLLQPILVRPVGDRYEIVYGHRRWLACMERGQEKITAAVRKLNDPEVAIMRATENVARQDLSPIEEAAVYADLRDTHGLTRGEIAHKMGKSTSIIQRRLDLLKMPPQLQKAIHNREISYSVGEVLWSLGDVDAIEYYLAFAVEHGATRAVVNAWVKDWKDNKRRQEYTSADSTPLENPLETRPVWVTCGICNGPAEVQTVEYLHVCPNCMKSIKTAMDGTPASEKGD